MSPEQLAQFYQFTLAVIRPTLAQRLVRSSQVEKRSLLVNSFTAHYCLKLPIPLDVNCSASFCCFYCCFILNFFAALKCLMNPRTVSLSVEKGAFK